MTPSRRGLFGLLAGALASPIVAKLPFVRSIDIVSPGQPYTTMPLMAQLNAVTRKAFVPVVRAQIYRSHPFMSLMARNNGEPKITLPTDGEKPVEFNWNGFDQ
jgi:hypothetical protein